MKLLKKITVILLLVVLLAAGGVFYAFKIEPYRIKLNRFALNGRQAGTSHIKILQISDLHVKEDYTSENLRKAVTWVNRQNPDIVLFTGDLYDNYASYHDDEQIILQLQGIRAKYEKIAIWGNRDYGGGAVRQYEHIMKSAGFTLLKNESLYVTLKEGEKILFTGLDDSLLGQPYMPDSAEIYNTVYKVLLTHEPDAVENYMDYSYDLALSGHSHGGQFDIPFLPFINEEAVTATSLSTKYSGGMYTLEEGKRRLYVNTGIGTTHISARFGVVPEITLFDLYI